MHDLFINVVVSTIYVMLGWALGHLSGWYFYHKAADDARTERREVQRSYDDLKDQLRQFGLVIQQGRIVTLHGQAHAQSVIATGGLTVTPPESDHGAQVDPM